MANRNFSPKQALEKEVKELFCKITFGASGAPTLVTGQQQGFESITRDAQGDYTLVLMDKYVALKSVEGIFLDDAAQDIRLQLNSDDVSDYAAAKSISFFTLTGATATDPASGQALLLKVEVKNSRAI